MIRQSSPEDEKNFAKCCVKLFRNKVDDNVLIEEVLQ
jgi:hypothetical protein